MEELRELCNANAEKVDEIFNVFYEDLKPSMEITASDLESAILEISKGNYEKYYKICIEIFLSYMLEKEDLKKEDKKCLQLLKIAYRKRAKRDQELKAQLERLERSLESRKNRN